MLPAATTPSTMLEIQNFAEGSGWEQIFPFSGFLLAPTTALLPKPACMLVTLSILCIPPGVLDLGSGSTGMLHDCLALLTRQDILSLYNMYICVVLTKFSFSLSLPLFSVFYFLTQAEGNSGSSHSRHISELKRI